MNKRIIIYILGWVLIVEGAAMQVCTVTSVIYREHEGLYFLLTGLISAAVGVVAVKFKKQKNMVLYQKAGFAATALSWILMSLVAALPFLTTSTRSLSRCRALPPRVPRSSPMWNPSATACCSGAA